MLIYHLYYKRIFPLWGLLLTKISCGPHTVITFCPETPQGTKASCGLCYLITPYCILCYLITASQIRSGKYRIRSVVFTWQAYGQLRFRTYGSQGDELLSRYGAAARKGRADIRHVKSSTQQTAMAFERIYALFY